MGDVARLVEDVTRELLSMPQADCPVRHFFAPGICVREISMPAGSMAVGHLQKYDHLNVFLSGKVRMLMDDGSFEDLHAPMIFVGKPGRKIGYIFEDMVWQNIYATDLTDPEAVEDYFLDKGEGDWFSKYRLSAQYQEDDGDYQAMLDDVGYTQEMVDNECFREDDLIPFPFGMVTVQVSASKIHGKGLFATAPMSAGDLIPANIGGKRTPAGRYTNHAKLPNAVPIVIDGDIYWQVVSDVRGNSGGMLGDEITVDYRRVINIARGGKCQEQ